MIFFTFPVPFFTIRQVSVHPFPAPPAHGRFISTQEASAAFTFRRMSPRTAFSFPLNRAQRNRALDTALSYYSLHLPGFSTPQSLDILRHTFDF